MIDTYQSLHAIPQMSNMYSDNLPTSISVFFCCLYCSKAYQDMKLSCSLSLKVEMARCNLSLLKWCPVTSSAILVLLWDYLMYLHNLFIRHFMTLNIGSGHSFHIGWYIIDLLQCLAFISFPLFGLLADVWIGRYRAVLIAIVQGSCSFHFVIMCIHVVDIDSLLLVCIFLFSFCCLCHQVILLQATMPLLLSWSLRSYLM